MCEFSLCKLTYSPVVEQSWTVAIVMCHLMQLRYIYNSVAKILFNMLEMPNSIPNSPAVKKGKVPKQLHLLFTYLSVAFVIICVV